MGSMGQREGGHQMGVEISVWILQSSNIISILKGSTPNATFNVCPFPLLLLSIILQAKFQHVYIVGDHCSFSLSLSMSDLQPKE
jgi:hypothetical protein